MGPPFQVYIWMITCYNHLLTHSEALGDLLLVLQRNHPFRFGLKLRNWVSIKLDKNINKVQHNKIMSASNQTLVRG